MKPTAIGWPSLLVYLKRSGRMLVNKKSRIHSNELSWTYRYVVCETEDRYLNAGSGQVLGGREIGRLREQQENVADSYMIREGERRRSQYLHEKLSGLVEETTYRCGPLPSAGAGPA